MSKKGGTPSPKEVRADPTYANKEKESDQSYQRHSGGERRKQQTERRQREFL